MPLHSKSSPEGLSKLESKDNTTGPTKATPKQLIKAIHQEAKVLEMGCKQKPKPTLENWQELLPTFKILHNAIYKESPVCIELVNGAGDIFHYGSLGNFSAIIGKAKSRKSFLSCLYLAASIKDGSEGFIKVSLPELKQRIVLIDTEQSEYDVSKNSKRILSMAKKTNPENFEVYSLRSLPPDDRLFMTEQLIYSKNDIGIVVIDGIRDFITDINSPAEATMITSRLMKWTQERHIHIIVVIHQNKGDNNARGHVGTEIINKSEAIIAVEKSNDISIARPNECRGKSFESFAFGVDQLGIPYILNDWTDGSNTPIQPMAASTRRIHPNNIPDETHKKYLTEIYKEEAAPKYSDLSSQIKLVFQSYGVTISDNGVRDYITYYQNKIWIKKEPTKPYTTYKLITPC